LLNEAWVVTTAVQVTTLPLILYNFRQLSLVTMIANLLILPVQPMVMSWGGVATIVGSFWLPMGRVLGWVAWLFLAYTIEMVQLTAKIPFASINLGRVSAGALWIYYGLLLAGVWIVSQDREARRIWWRKLTDRLPTMALIGGLAIVLILVWIAVLDQPDGRLHVVFFDVGQGDAIFVQSPAGQQILVDGGPDPTILLARLGEQMPFWDRSLDLVVLTHPDDDHLTGLVPVLERYRVGQVFDVGHACNSPTCAKWQELLAGKGIPVLDSRAGTHVVLDGGVELTVLHPGHKLVEGTEADSNNNSIVIRLIMGEFSALMPGDVEAVVERKLLHSGQQLVSTLLKVPHHGSDTSSTPAFLEAVSPQLAVVSVGQDNRFGHPSSEVLARLRPYTVLRTDEQGNVEVITDGQRLWVETQH
jgi:competence protein ComEC